MCMLQGPSAKDAPVCCYQVLDKKRANVLVKTFDTQKQLSSTWVLQPLEIWRANSVTSDTQMLDTFRMAGPCKANMFDIFGVDLSQRASFKMWTPTESDLYGCMCLHQPKSITSALMLSDSRVPVACLLDALAEQEHIARPQLHVHAPLAGLYYDSRNLQSKRTYLQAVLAASTIFARGMRIIMGTVICNCKSRVRV